MRVLMILAVLLGMGAALIEANRGHDITIGMGQLEPNPEAIAGGYFVLNEATLIAVKPGSVSHDLLKNIAYEGRKGSLIFRVDE